MNEKEKLIAAIDGIDYLDVAIESETIVFTLNWERLIVDKKRIEKIEFKFDPQSGRANEILIHMDSTTIEVPINIESSDAISIEIKSKRLLGNSPEIQKR